MTDQAKILRGLMEHHQYDSVSDREQQSKPIHQQSQSQRIMFTSGKGGVGKSNLALNLAVALAKAGDSVCLIDASPGLGNLDLLCGLNAYWNMSHVISGARKVSEIILPGPEGIQILPGMDHLSKLDTLSHHAAEEIVSQLQELERQYDYLIFDGGAGYQQAIEQIFMPIDSAIVITTPEPTAIADAYATLKSLANSDITQLELLVNQVNSTEQGTAILERIQSTVKLFLKKEIETAGFIQYDQAVIRAVGERTPFQISEPHSQAARSISELVRRLKRFNRSDVSSRDQPMSEVTSRAA